MQDVIVLSKSTEGIEFIFLCKYFTQLIWAKSVSFYNQIIFF